MIPQDTIRIIAHRGVHDIYPENSLEAVQRAIELNIETIEIDVQVSKDGVPVVFHDETLERMTGHAGFIWDYSLDELKQMDIGSGCKIPTLEEVLSLNFGRSELMIEVKKMPNGPDPADAVIALLKRKKHPPCYFASYNLKCLVKAKKQLPHIKLIGIADDFKDAVNLRTCEPHIMALSHRAHSAHINKYFHALDIHPWAFTVNSPEAARELVALGVIGIITNDVAAIQLLRAIKKS